MVLIESQMGLNSSTALETWGLQTPLHTSFGALLCTAPSGAVVLGSGEVFCSLGLLLQLSSIENLRPVLESYFLYECIQNLRGETPRSLLP